MVADQTFVETVISIITRIAIAVGVLLLGRYLAGKARATTRHVLSRPQLDQAFSASMERILVDLAFYSVFAVAIIIDLTILGVPAAAVLSITSGFFLVLAIAFRESLANFAATIIFFIFQPFRQDEEIETMGKRGTVQEIQLFNTVLITADKAVISLPNGQIQESGVVNFSRLRISRADIDFTVDYTMDVDRVRRVVSEVMALDPRVLREPAPAVVVLSLGENGFQVQARPVTKVEDAADVRFDLRERIKARFDADGIVLAASRRDVRLTSTPFAVPEAESTIRSSSD